MGVTALCSQSFRHQEIRKGCFLPNLKPLQLRRHVLPPLNCCSIDSKSFLDTSGVVQVSVKTEVLISNSVPLNKFQFYYQSQDDRLLIPYWTQTYFFHHDFESIFILSAVLRTFLSRRALLSDCRSPTAIAASNTSFRFFCVRAEHSTYVTAPILSASVLASSSATGLSRRLDSSISTLTSCRKSHCVPTRRTGVRGQRRRISGTHFSQTF